MSKVLLLGPNLYELHTLAAALLPKHSVTIAEQAGQPDPKTEFDVFVLSDKFGALRSIEHCRQLQDRYPQSIRVMIVDLDSPILIEALEHTCVTVLVLRSEAQVVLSHAIDAFRPRARAE